MVSFCCLVLCLADGPGISRCPADDGAFERSHCQPLQAHRWIFRCRWRCRRWPGGRFGGWDALQRFLIPRSQPADGLVSLFSFTLDGQAEHYLNLSCGGVEVGWELCNSAEVGWERHVLHHFGVGTVMQGLRGESGQGEENSYKTREKRR
jgi:hypothetical protein